MRAHTSAGVSRARDADWRPPRDHEFRVVVVVYIRTSFTAAAKDNGMFPVVDREEIGPLSLSLSCTLFEPQTNG